MRRVLNLLQTTAMSFKKVDDDSVYLTSGTPIPVDVEAIIQSLLNDNFAGAYTKITALCKTKGYAIADLLSQLTIMVSGIELPPGALAVILDGMSGVEYILACGTDEEIQCESLVGVFVRARIMMSVK